MNKLVTIVLFVLVGGVTAVAQKDLVMSQYMHNRYSVNSAFAGNREALSLNGTFRKKWMGINGSPSAQYFSGHSPLRNEKVALGMDVYNQQYGVTRQSGFSLSYTYRLKMNNDRILSFGLSGGMSFNASNWTDIVTLKESDPEFQNNENVSSPLVGFGVAWYGKNFFAGVSAPNLFKYDISEGGSSEFAPGDVNYILTGGYLFGLSQQLDLQPTVLARFNPAESTHIDLNATLIYSEMIWLGVSYRTTSDVVALLGYQVTPQLRFSYSFDYTLGEISTYNNGTHEIGIQFDFGYKIKTPNPKFF